MPDGSNIQSTETNEQSILDYLSCQSDDFGELAKAGAFVYQDYEPADDETAQYVADLAQALQLPTTGKTGQKYQRCLSDFLMAVRVTSNGKIAWPMGSENFYTQPYGHKVAKKVKSRLKADKLELFQKASKRDKLSRLYSVDKSLCPDWLRFSKHGEGPLVVVKSPKVRNKSGKLTGGTRMGRTNFLPAIQKLEDQVKRINYKMMDERLCDPISGSDFVRCYRVFNNGSLKCGGRLYGRWQSWPEEERLAMTIGGEPVVEIDIKASFLSMAHSWAKSNAPLTSDPYSAVPFVKTAKSDEEAKERRKVIKLLINAYFFKGGKVSQFPRGKKKDEDTKKTIPVKEQYSLEYRVSYYMDEIHSTFPFLRTVKADGMSLMFRESVVMVDAIDHLLEKDVVSYPVHDCLIVKASDKDIALQEIQNSMMRHEGFIPTVDISWLDDQGQLETEIVVGNFPTKQALSCKLADSEAEVDDLDDDFDVLEDY